MSLRDDSDAPDSNVPEAVDLHALPWNEMQALISVGHNVEGVHAFIFPERRLGIGRSATLCVETQGRSSYAIEIPSDVASRLIIISVQWDNEFCYLEVENISNAPLLTVAALCVFKEHSWRADGDFTYVQRLNGEA